jgi:S1-C subfamily serine protease
MKNLLCVLAMLALWAPVVQAGEPTDYKSKHDQMLSSVVLVDIGEGSGSGTVIYSAEFEGEIHTYILTNFHVVASAVTISEEWNSKLGKNVDVERRQPVDAYWFEYIRYSINTGKRGQRAEIVAYNAKMDLALIRLVDTENTVTPVSPIIPQNDTVHLMESVWAIGSGMGYPPFATRGEIAAVDGRQSGMTYMMSTAPIVWGNSGGALFRWSDDRVRFELVGVPSRITIAGFRFPIFQMSWAVPAVTIYEFLENNNLCFIFAEPCPAEEDDESEK